jgi:Domain of unknown function (DUF4328)
MAIAWWFLPFANLVVPYLVHRDIYERYHRGLGVGAGFVLLWWLVYIGSGIFGTIVGNVWQAAVTFAELQSGLTLYVVSGLVDAISAVIAIVLVRRIQGRADVLAISGPPEAVPVPAETAAS